MLPQPGVVELNPALPPAPLQAPLATGVLDEDAAHGFGRRGEEVAPALPALSLVRIDEAEVRLVDQRRDLERLVRLLLRQLLGGQLRIAARPP